MKMKAVLRKNNCLAAIGERLMEITDDKCNEINGNVISNLYLALADGVLFSMTEKNIAKEIWDTLTKIVRGQVTTQQNLLEEEILYSSNDGIYNGD